MPHSQSLKQQNAQLQQHTSQNNRTHNYNNTLHKTTERTITTTHFTKQQNAQLQQHTSQKNGPKSLSYLEELIGYQNHKMRTKAKRRNTDTVVHCHHYLH